MSEILSPGQYQENSLLNEIKSVFNENNFHILNSDEKDDEQYNLSRYFNQKIDPHENDDDQINNEPDNQGYNSKQEKDNQFEPVKENIEVCLIDPFPKQEKKILEKIVEVPMQKKEEEKEEEKGKEGLVKGIEDENQLNPILNNNLETRYDNEFTEVKEPEYLLIGEKKFKIFNPPNKKNKLRYLQKPIFQTFIPGQKRKRHLMKDLMRKKHKTIACKDLIIILKSKLKDLNINDEFKLPQTMVTNVAKKENEKILDMTLKEILIERYFDKDKEINDNNITIEENNKKILNLIEQENDENINEILHMNMSDIYAEFLESAQFQRSIRILDKKDYSYEYIYNYIKVAEKFVKFYSSKKSKKD